MSDFLILLPFLILTAWVVHDYLTGKHKGEDTDDDDEWPWGCP